MRWLVLVAISACSAGAEHPAAPVANHIDARSPALEVTMERTSCLGTCPAYTVKISATGSADYAGDGPMIMPTGQVSLERPHVDHHRQLDAAQRATLARAIERIHFFDLGPDGFAPRRGLPEIVVCTDTSHTVLTVRRDNISHSVDDAHCLPNAPLSELEQLVDELADSEAAYR